MKIFRLSLFNIRKHKTETVSVFLLLLLCVTILASAVSGITGLDNIVDNAYERTGCYHNFIYMPETSLRNEYVEKVENDERITKYKVTHCADDFSLKYINRQGKEISQSIYLFSDKTDSDIQNLILDSPYTIDEIREKEHFIIMPYFAHDTLGYNVGDSFELLYNEKVYPFEVAGFFEATFFCDAANFRCIISESDLSTMETLLTKEIMIAFETETEDEAADFCKEFFDYVDEISISNDSIKIATVVYKDLKMQSTISLKLLMGLMIGMSAIIFAAVTFMVRFRIKSDIDEQLVSIGVLESLGYKSGEIALSYVLEYLLVSLPAVIIGLGISLVTGPALFSVGEIMLGYRGTEKPANILPLISGILILALVALISYFRAHRIKKIPPVVAFRKGTETHTHKRDILPLEKSTGNVHIRLAAKGYLSNIKSNIGMSICISIASIAFIVCFVFYDFVNHSTNAIGALGGVDMADMSVIAMAGTDIDELQEEILSMEDVERINKTNVFFMENVKIKDNALNIFAYDDFDSIQNVTTYEGRLPKHDNEIVLKTVVLNLLRLKVGDTITLESGKYSADYIICGSTKTPFTIGFTTYMTTEGYKRLNPEYQPTQLDIFLKNGVDTAEFKKLLNNRYGISDENTSENSLEEKIRAAADEKISDLLEIHGVNSIDYAINIDGQIISGNSSHFKIKYGMSLAEYCENALSTQMQSFKLCAAIFMFISAVVIAMIVFLVIYSNVKKQRGEYGIMKGMGYTSKELMLQTALKVIPTLVVSVALGGFFAYIVGSNLYSPLGSMPLVTVKVALISIAVVVFGFVVAYLSAKRIKNISVYELMQE